MIYEDMTQEDVDSIIDGYFSSETTEDLYEPSDDELLYPSRHYDWVYVKSPKNKMEDDWKCVNGMFIPF